MEEVMFPEFRDPRNDPRKGRSYNQQLGGYPRRHVVNPAPTSAPQQRQGFFPWFAGQWQDFRQDVMNPIGESIANFAQRPEWGFKEFDEAVIQPLDNLNFYPTPTPTPTPTPGRGKTNQSPAKPPTLKGSTKSGVTKRKSSSQTMVNPRQYSRYSRPFPSYGPPKPQKRSPTKKVGGDKR